MDTELQDKRHKLYEEAELLLETGNMTQERYEQFKKDVLEVTDEEALPFISETILQYAPGGAIEHGLKIMKEVEQRELKYTKKGNVK